MFISFPVAFSSNRDISARNFMMHEPHCRRHVELCKVCKEPVPKSQMEEHMEEHAEVPCAQCQKMVAKDMMDNHLVSLCTQYPDEPTDQML